jgi:hypothetical protein
MKTYTQEDVNVRLHVQLGFAITLGLYDGPITREIVAENVRSLIANVGDKAFAEFIEKIVIHDVHLDDGEVLVGEEG